MNTKTVIVHCTYSEDGRDIADIIRESFHVFLLKELRIFAAPNQESVS